ncbi:MAG: isoamylase early set domain-containing protein [Gemmatimonadaceae bacterium]
MEERDDRFLEEVAVSLRAPVQPGSGFEARVMASVRAGANDGVLRWITRPRVVRLSPLAGLAAAAGIALAAVSINRLDRVPDSPRLAASAPAIADTVKLVQFMLVAPEAHSVSVVGDFNDWDPTATPLREAGEAGVWTITVPLAAGRHQYVFMVDGNRWTPDPAAPRAVEDGFGMPNSVITLGESAT